MSRGREYSHDHRSRPPAPASALSRAPRRATSGSSSSPRSPPGSRSASCSSSASSPEATSRGSSAVRSLRLGAGFALLAVASTRFTSQPQRWALVPGVASVVVGVGRLALAPGERFLDLAGWVWPVLLAILVVSSFRGARRSLDNWSRRALLYPALVVLSLIAVGGAVGTVMAATSSNPAPTSGHTYLANGHRLYLNCVGSGSPTVVLFNGLGEWTPNWAWVQANVSATTRVCAFDRAGEGWSGGKADSRGRSPAGVRPARALARRACPRAVCPRRTLRRRHLRARLRRAVSEAGRRGRADRLGDAVSVRPSGLPARSTRCSSAPRRSCRSAARTAMGRMALRSGFGSLPPRARDAARAFNSSPRQLTASRIEFLQLPTVFNQAKALRSLTASRSPS